MKLKDAGSKGGMIVDKRIFLPLKRAFAKVRSMWLLLSEYEDITDQVTLMNGWTNPYGSFRVLKVPGALIVSGLLKPGTISAETNIAKLPNDIWAELDERCQYTYGVANYLSKHTSSLFVIRSGYLRIDNNLPFDGGGNNVGLFAVNGIFPIANFSLGGGYW